MQDNFLTVSISNVTYSQNAYLKKIIEMGTA